MEVTSVSPKLVIQFCDNQFYETWVCNCDPRAYHCKAFPTGRHIKINIYRRFVRTCCFFFHKLWLQGIRIFLLKSNNFRHSNFKPQKKKKISSICFEGIISFRTWRLLQLRQPEGWNIVISQWYSMTSTQTRMGKLQQVSLGVKSQATAVSTLIFSSVFQMATFQQVKGKTIPVTVRGGP
jgi:hypothetical protein